MRSTYYKNKTKNKTKPKPKHNNKKTLLNFKYKQWKSVPFLPGLFSSSPSAQYTWYLYQSGARLKTPGVLPVTVAILVGNA